MILSKRQREIAELMIWDNEYISEKLNLSVLTVKNHIHTILKKVGAESRTQALIFLLQMGELNLYKIDTRIVDAGFWNTNGVYKTEFTTMESEYER